MTDSTPTYPMTLEIRDWTLRDGHWEATEAAQHLESNRQTWRFGFPLTVAVLALLIAVVVLAGR